MQKDKYNVKYLERWRRSLRTGSTPAEVVFWRYLKNRQLDGRRFRRQFSVDNYILDFYCPEERLCIELDGQNHLLEEGKASDAARDASLKEKHNITTLRFENAGVWNNLDGLLAEVRKHFKADR